MELYVHLPFCRSKCRYCDFASWPNHEAMIPAYVDAVLAEAAWRAETIGNPRMETVFFGGGTPSLLPPEEMMRLIDGLKAAFPVAEDAEWTCEANPGTLTAAWLEAALAGGVNRLSLGVQAAQPHLLKALGRIHTAKEAQEAATLARMAGFRHISLDLMFGLPGQTMEDWRETLAFALSLKPEHLSCYGLIVEPDTPMEADVAAGRVTLPDEDEERAMYDEAISSLKAAGFEQHEISNFALPGRACRHNLGYWRQIPYLGLGCAAASMLPAREENIVWSRETNPADLPAYLNMVNACSASQRDIVPVTPADAQFETLMLGLRLTDGVSEADFLCMHGVPMDAIYGDRLRRLEQQGLLRHQDGRWMLTRRGMDVQNGVLVELMGE